MKKKLRLIKCECGHTFYLPVRKFLTRVKDAVSFGETIKCPVCGSKRTTKMRVVTKEVRE